MKETRSHDRALRRTLRSKPPKEPVVVRKVKRRKQNRKSLAKPPKETEQAKEALEAKGARLQEESQCNSCFDVSDKLFSFPCSHSFCEGCVRGLFLAALDDQSLLPVKCCGKRVDQRLRRAVLTEEECARFETTLDELEAVNSMYCPKPECSAFHNLSTIAQGSNGQFRCSGCELVLCARCRASHPQMSCAAFRSLPSADRSLNDVLFFHMAQKSRYARCNRCHRFVEHSAGCYNMYCRCGHTFSYVAERYTGATTSSSAFTARNPTTATQVRAGKNTAYAREEAPCSHTWTQYNAKIDGSLLCHLCRHKKRCYQVECSKCYRRACPSCARDLTK